MHPLILTSGTRELSAHLFKPEHSNRKAVLMIHGWGSAQTRNYELATSLCERGFTCMTFDLSAHGESAGRLEALSCADFLSDAINAYDTLVRESRCTDVAVIGSSFGSYIGAIVTSERAVSKLILRVPADYPDEGFNEVHVGGKWSGEKVTWRGEIRAHDATRALRAVHAYTGPFLLIESELDDVCPHQCIQNYANAVVDQAKLTHWLQKGAPHSLTKYPDLKKEYEAKVLEWM